MKSQSVPDARRLFGAQVGWLFSKANRPRSAGTFFARLGSLFSHRTPRNIEAETTKFSIIVRGSSRRHLKATLYSLRLQRNVQFDVIVACAEKDAPGKLLRRPPYELKYSAFTQLATLIETATGDYIVLLDAGDELVPNCLAIFAQELRQNSWDVAYCDEEIEGDAGQSAEPLLKPSWSPELLTSYDYFGHLTAIRRELVSKVLKGTADESETASLAASEWDLKLRVTEYTNAVGRIPQRLCRRPAGVRPKELLLREAGSLSQALAAHYQRLGLKASVTSTADGTLQATWPLSAMPLVSVVIPNKNRADLLSVCLEGLQNKTSYSPLEIIVVDNDSTELSAIKLYDHVRSCGVRIVSFNEPFNYSRACNRGAAEASGDLLLFLNNDIEIVEPEWLTTLVREAVRPGVGVVGAKLVYPDGQIQHAGVAIGLFQLAAHVFHRAPHAEWGPFGSPDTKRNWLAVTGACQLMRRDVFDLVGGYDEAFTLAYSDVVICLDAWRFGLRTVYQPAAQLMHHEGASRGLETPGGDFGLFARRLRALGIGEDPYFHPDIYKEAFIPELRTDEADVAQSEPMRGDLEELGAFSPDKSALDVYDDATMADAIGARWASMAEPLDIASLSPNLDSIALFIITLLRRRKDLRERFPLALSAGPNGTFSTWLKQEGLRRAGLSEEYGLYVDAVFGADLGARPQQWLLYDEEFRKENPLFLLPAGRLETCKLLFEAVSRHELRRLDVWWFLLQSAEDPLGQLYATWAVTPEWQAAVPDGGTIFGAARLVDWVATAYGLNDGWLRTEGCPHLMSDAQQLHLAFAEHESWRASFPDAMTLSTAANDLLRSLSSPNSGLSSPARTWAGERIDSTFSESITRLGLNVLGHFSYPSGLRISTESIVTSLRTNDVDLSLRDVPVNLLTDEPISHRFRGVEVYDTTLIHVQPEPLFQRVYEQANLHARGERTHRIGYWYWEFDEIPEEWDHVAQQCDEIWTATTFIAEGLRRRYSQPVKVFMPGLEIPSFTRLPRSYFELQTNRFVFLFVFHMTSVMERKNPLGLIKAFRAAFQPSEPVDLVIKVTFSSEDPDQFAALQKATEVNGVHLIDKNFSRDETLSLIAASDSYVSLHRSEGLGLSLAEAMLLGKPVIGTRYSGNLEFMNDGNSLLVDCEMMTLDEDVPPYKAGLRWANPSITQAAQHMRRLYEDRDFARSLGALAKADLEQRLNYRATGAGMAHRLREIQDSRKSA